MSRFILLVAVVAVAACGGDGSTTAPPTPVSVAVTPSNATVNPGDVVNFSASVSNSANTAVTWTASAGTITPSGTSASWTAPVVGGSYTITATSAADASRSGTAAVTVNPVGVTVTPSATTVGAGDTITVNASISNTSNQGVTWSASAGTIIGSGASVQWAAPVAGGSYTVTATSTVDPSRSASRTLTVTPVQVQVTAAKGALVRGETTSLTAAVSGTSATAVTWSATCGVVAGNGTTVQFTAPESGGPCEVAAASVRDPAQSGRISLAIRPVLRVAVLDDTNDGTCTFQHCTLREALIAANATPTRDSIIIEAGPAAATIPIGSSLPFITAPVDIVGPGAALLTLDGGTSTTTLRSMLYFAGRYSASVRGLTVRGGRRNGGGGMVVDDTAEVTLRNVVLRSNESVDGPGGGLLALRGGRATLVDVEIVENLATGSNGLGGGIAVQAGSQVAMTRGRVADNESRLSNGGGIRIFNGAVTLDSVSVTGNKAPATATGGSGAGIYTDGAETVLQLVNATISGNVAGISGGGLALRGGTTATITGTTIRANQAPLGGGVELGSSSVTAVNSTIAANTVTSRAGGVFVSGNGRWTQQGGAIRENAAGNDGGGGLYAQDSATVTLTDVAVRENRVNGFGGAGLWVSGNAALSMTGGAVSRNQSGAAAGGLFLIGSRPASLTRVAVDSNTAATGAGGILLTNTTATITEGRIVGNTLAAGGGGGIFADRTTLTMQDTRVVSNRAVGNGGGLLAITGGTYTLRDVVVEENSATNGAGLGFNGQLAITIEGGVLRNNTASAVGGGLWKAAQSTLTMTGTQVLGNRAGTQGGGLQLVAPGAPATLRRLTVRGNQATGASGGGVTAGVVTLIENSLFADNTTGAIGGGIFAAASGNTTVRNSTFSRNSAVVGGGIAATGPATVVNATFVANSASDYGGGIGTNNSGAMSVSNLLLADNLANGVAGDCGRGGSSTITSAGGNLSGDASCTMFTVGSDKPNTTPGVNSTLADNGGPTLTHALLAGSAAIDAAVAASCPATDQRGAPRVGTCDIGAVEFGSTPPAALKRPPMRRSP